MNSIHQVIMRRFSVRLSVFICFIFINLNLGFTQEELVEDSNTVENALSIDQISSETESLRGKIKDLREILKPTSQTLEIDSLIDSVYINVMIEKDSLYSEIDVLSRRELKNRSVIWEDFRNKLKSTQNVLTNRNEQVYEISEDLVLEVEKWKNTKLVLSQNTESEDVFSSLDTMIITLNGLIDYSHVRLDSLFKIEKRITELILIVDEANSEIARFGRQKQKEYFVLDSPPFWLLFTEDTNQVEEVLDSTIVKEGVLKSGFQNDVKSLTEFVDASTDKIVLQIVFILFTLSLLIFLRFRWGNTKLPLANEMEFQIKTIFANPISSALILGVLVSSFFYTAVIPVFSELQVLVVISAATFLLPRLTHKKITLFMVLILSSFILQTTEPYFLPRSIEIRGLLVVKSVFILLAIWLGRKTMLAQEASFGKLIKLFRFLLPLYGFLALLTIAFNGIGMVNLTDILLNGILISISLGTVVFLAVKITTILTLFIFQLRKAKHTESLSIVVEATTKRIQPIMAWIGLILWVVFTLKGFDFYTNLTEWAAGLLEINWKIGETRISLGSILSFTGLLIASLLIAKLVASIFQDEWMLKVLPRGVAPATSLILRILVISIGVYVAFSAAGFDVGKLGIVFGALSVGIGFGLQNVVLNFIAGLILAFERPINLGDAIEIDNEMGEVTNIGVRSSNIRTYSGAEAIIPNGDLISKKVVNWTLTDRDRRSKIRMRTSSKADPNEVIALFNKVAESHPKTYKDPAPKTYFYGYGEDGNLEFALLYWSSFSDTLKTNSEIALTVFNELKAAGFDAPIPNQRNFD